MEYSFTCYGHENITAKHKTTLEFTKDGNLGLDGDCIVGVGADFNLDSLKEFIKSLNDNNKVAITIKIINSDFNNKNNIDKKKLKNNDLNDKIVEKINAEINPGFNSDKEIVIRKSDFISDRTFAIKADKAAFEMNSKLVGFLNGGRNKVRVIVQS